MSRRSWIASVVLILLILGTGGGLTVWKRASIAEANAAAANQPEPMESVAVAVAKGRKHTRTTTAIGTVMALRSITLSNEVAGTVRKVELTPGEVVEADTLLVALDVSVEEAELHAQEAQAALAESVLGRMQRASQNHGASEMDVDRARSEHDVALAQVMRTKAIINRKTLRAPFRARMGMSDVHVGQYLKEGTLLTTLQGVDDAVNVDFTVAQGVAAGMKVGDSIDVFSKSDAKAMAAKIVAIDARIDPATRNAMVRARVDSGAGAFAPGASVRVRVPIGPPQDAVVIPVSALRKGPDGDHVFVVAPDKEGKTRAHVRKVQSGTMLGDEIVILDGLATGEQIAASGSFKLREGVLVVIVKEAQ